jgi:hypothetical protein
MGMDVAPPRRLGKTLAIGKTRTLGKTRAI